MSLPDRDNFGPAFSPNSVFEPSITNPSFSSRASNLDSPRENEMDGPAYDRRSARLSLTNFLTDSPASITRPVSTGSGISTGSIFEWNPVDILDLSDRVRAAVQQKGIHGIAADDLKVLHAMLDRFLHDELKGKVVDFSVIVDGRIDKMLEAFRSDPKVLLEDSTLRASLEKASALRNQWVFRFGSKYSAIDVARLAPLKWKWETGWEAQLSDKDLEVGSWWPNLECVLRDGFIRTLDETASHGRTGLFWMLPMLTGIEVDGPQAGLYTFKREGSLQDMHIRLMNDEGKPIRVLRGHTLNSKYAPTAGIRYDGEYILQTYKFGPRTDKLEKLELVLKRVDDQLSLDDLLNIPTPSQQDDWHMYKQITG